MFVHATAQTSVVPVIVHLSSLSSLILWLLLLLNISSSLWLHYFIIVAANTTSTPLSSGLMHWLFIYLLSFWRMTNFSCTTDTSTCYEVFLRGNVPVVLWATVLILDYISLLLRGTSLNLSIVRFWFLLMLFVIIIILN